MLSICSDSDSESDLNVISNPIKIVMKRLNSYDDRQTISNKKRKCDESSVNAPNKRKQSTQTSNNIEPSAKRRKSKSGSSEQSKWPINNDMHDTICPVPKKLCKMCGESFNVDHLIQHQKKVHGEVYNSRLSNRLVRIQLRIKGEVFAFDDKQVGSRRFCSFCVDLHKHTYEEWFIHFTQYTGEYIWECEKHGPERTKNSCRCNKKQVEEIPVDGIHGYICNDDQCNYIQLFPQNIKKHMETVHRRDPDLGFKKVLLMPKFDRLRQRRKSVVNAQVASIPKDKVPDSDVPVTTNDESESGPMAVQSTNVKMGVSAAAAPPTPPVTPSPATTSTQIFSMPKPIKIENTSRTTMPRMFSTDSGIDNYDDSYPASPVSQMDENMNNTVSVLTENLPPIKLEPIDESVDEDAQTECNTNVKLKISNPRSIKKAFEGIPAVEHGNKDKFNYYFCTKCPILNYAPRCMLKAVTHFIENHENEIIELRMENGRRVKYYIVCNLCESNFSTKTSFISHFTNKHKKCIVDASVVIKGEVQNANESSIYLGQRYKCLNDSCKKTFAPFYSIDSIVDHLNKKHRQQKFECAISEPSVFPVKDMEKRNILFEENGRFDQHYLYVCPRKECECRFFATIEQMQKFHDCRKNSYYKFHYSVKKLHKCYYCPYISTIDMMKEHFNRFHSDHSSLRTTDVVDSKRCGNCYYRIDKEIQTETNNFLTHYRKEHFKPNSFDLLSDEMLQQFIAKNSEVDYYAADCCQFYFNSMIELIEHFKICKKSLEIKGAKGETAVIFKNGFAMKLKYFINTPIGREISEKFDRNVLQFAETELGKQLKRRCSISIVGENLDTISKISEWMCRDRSDINEQFHPWLIVDAIAPKLGIKIKSDDWIYAEFHDNGQKIIVEFRSYEKKKQIKQAYYRKRILRVSELDENKSLILQDKLYINDNLTLYYENLATIARNAKKSGKLHSTWTEDCRIMVKKSRGSKAIRILNEKMLSDIIDGNAA